jgi:heme-degrading monooxygenase HmoA
VHARTVVVQVSPENVQEVIRIFRDSVIPAAQQQKGWKGGMLLTDSTTGKTLSVGLWETEADLVASETGPYFQEQLAKIRHIVTAPPVREIYEVSVNTF